MDSDLDEVAAMDDNALDVLEMFDENSFCCWEDEVCFLDSFKLTVCAVEPLFMLFTMCGTEIVGIGLISRFGGSSSRGFGGGHTMLFTFCAVSKLYHSVGYEWMVEKIDEKKILVLLKKASAI